MSARTSQLQIRVTPAEKDALKRLASAAGDTLSGYVLSKVLPSAELELVALMQRLVEIPGDTTPVLTELADALDGPTAPDVVRSVPEPDLAALPAVQANRVAALVESRAHEQRVRPPDWTGTVAPLERPWFGWALSSLRAHQLRVAPVAFKRRNIFFDPAAAPALASGRRGASKGAARRGPESPGPEQWLAALSERLAAENIEVEFYFVGGALISQAFASDPGTANIAAIFRPAAPVDDAVRDVAHAEGLPQSWLHDAVRRVLAGPGPSGRGYLELSHVRVFEPLPEHVLAVKCAAMRLGEDFHELDDIRFVARAMNVWSADGALAVVTRYLPERQLLPEARARLEGLLSS